MATAPLILEEGHYFLFAPHIQALQGTVTFVTESTFGSFFPCPDDFPRPQELRRLKTLCDSLNFESRFTLINQDKLVFLVGPMKEDIVLAGDFRGKWNRLCEVVPSSWMAHLQCGDDDDEVPQPSTQKLSDDKTCFQDKLCVFVCVPHHGQCCAFSALSRKVCTSLPGRRHFPSKSRVHAFTDRPTVWESAAPSPFSLPDCSPNEFPSWFLAHCLPHTHKNHSTTRRPKTIVPLQTFHPLCFLHNPNVFCFHSFVTISRGH